MSYKMLEIQMGLITFGKVWKPICFRSCKILIAPRRSGRISKANAYAIQMGLIRFRRVWKSLLF